MTGRIFAALNAFVEARHLGQCFPDNTGFLLAGVDDTVRSPDVAFVSRERLPAAGVGLGWVPAAPDLVVVVEIISPSETASALEQKLQDYWSSGVRLAWVVDPAARVVSVRDADGHEHMLSETDSLDGGGVLRGFGFPVSSLFMRLAT